LEGRKRRGGSEMMHVTSLIVVIEKRERERENSPSWERYLGWW